MQNEHDMLGKVIKQARLANGLTYEQLAERVGISERYLYRIENKKQKPSYDMLFKLIRELSIPADLIFYPEQTPEMSELDYLVRSLYQCDPRSLQVVRAVVKTLLDTADNK